MPGYPVTAPLPPYGRTNRISSISPRCLATGGLPPSVSTDFTDTAVVATTLFIAELPVPYAVTSKGFAVLNGSVVTNGNTKIGIFDASGALVAATAATASAGVDSFQRIAWAFEFVSVPGVETALTNDLQLTAGTYFVAALGSSTSDKFNTHTIGNFGAISMTGATNATAMRSTSLTITPPTTFTTAVGPVGSLY